MRRLRNAFFPLGLLFLIGCGGSGHVSRAAHLRFFDALSDTSNIRLYVGGHLYEAKGVGPSIEFGDDVAYGDVPSGTVDFVVNNYTDRNSAGGPNSLALLQGQTLRQGNNYTAVALIAGTTKRIVLFADNATLFEDRAYLRVFNASTNQSPFFVQLVSKSTGNVVYQTNTTAGVPSGSQTGLQSVFTDTATEDYLLEIYSDRDFTDRVGSTTVTLQAGKAITTFVYNQKSGSGLSFKSSLGRDQVTASTALGSVN